MRYGLVLVAAVCLWAIAADPAHAQVNVVCVAGCDGSDLDTLIGEVQETPTTYTLLGRLKSLEDLFGNFTPPGVAEGAVASAGVTLQPAGFVKCGSTPTAGTGVADGDYTQLCGTGFRALWATLAAPDGTPIEYGSSAEVGAATPTDGVQDFGACDDTSTAAVSEGNSGTLRLNCTTRELLTQAAPKAKSTGGATIMSFTSAGSTEDEHAVCTAACTIYSILVTNTNAAARYFRCNDDTAANTAPGSETLKTNGGGGTQVIDIAIPGNAAGAGFSIPLPVGAAFATAATCWMVTGAAITDVAEVAANEIKVVYTYAQ